MLLFSQGNPGLATAPAEKTIAPAAPWDLATSLPSPQVSHTDPMGLGRITKLSGVSVSTSSRGEQSPCPIESHTTELATSACAGLSSLPLIPSPTPPGAYPIPTW